MFLRRAPALLASSLVSCPLPSSSRFSSSSALSRSTAMCICRLTTASSRRKLARSSNYCCWISSYQKKKSETFLLKQQTLWLSLCHYIYESFRQCFGPYALGHMLEAMLSAICFQLCFSPYALGNGLCFGPYALGHILSAISSKLSCCLLCMCVSHYIYDIIMI